MTGFVQCVGSGCSHPFPSYVGMISSISPSLLINDLLLDDEVSGESLFETLYHDTNDDTYGLLL